MGTNPLYDQPITARFVETKRIRACAILLLSLATLARLPIIGNFFLLPTLIKRPQQGIIFYDNECGVCSKSVQFLMRKAKARHLRYAPIGGRTYTELFPEQHRIRKADTIVYLEKTGAQAYVRSTAVWKALSHCESPYRWLVILAIVPREISDLIYMLIARVRKRIFGTECILPSPEERSLFLD